MSPEAIKRTKFIIEQCNAVIVVGNLILLVVNAISFFGGSSRSGYNFVGMVACAIGMAYPFYVAHRRDRAQAQVKKRGK